MAGLTFTPGGRPYVRSRARRAAAPPPDARWGCRGRDARDRAASGASDANYYTDEEFAFLRAILALKRTRPRPAWADVLGAALALGYRRGAAPDAAEYESEMRRFGREHKRPFPAWTEALAVLKSLGYALPA